MSGERKYTAEELEIQDLELLDAIDRPPYRRVPTEDSIEDPVEFEIPAFLHMHDFPYESRDDGRPSTAEDYGMKTANPKQAYGDKKLPLHLIPPAASAYTAMGLREGAMKYGAWNFRETPIELMTYIGAIKRHCDAILEGEWIDPDPIILPDGTEVLDIPKKPHLAGIMASAAILADQWENGTIVDNRPNSNKGYAALMKEHMKK